MDFKKIKKVKKKRTYTTVAITIGIEQIKKLKTIAHTEKVSVSAIFQSLVNDFLTEEKNKEV